MWTYCTIYKRNSLVVCQGQRKSNILKRKQPNLISISSETKCLFKNRKILSRSCMYLREVMRAQKGHFNVYPNKFTETKVDSSTTVWSQLMLKTVLPHLRSIRSSTPWTQRDQGWHNINNNFKNYMYMPFILVSALENFQQNIQRWLKYCFGSR